MREALTLLLGLFSRMATLLLLCGTPLLAQTSPPATSAVKVTIYPRPNMRVPVGGSQIVTAKVDGTTNTAVKWSIAGAGCSDSGCGTISGGLYVAPTMLSRPLTAKLTATSEADPSATDSITVYVGLPQSVLAQDQKAEAMGAIDVLGDTMGVDFGPYLSRVLHDVKQNWYNRMPERARPPIMKKGKVAIEFAILKDGSVAGMRFAEGGNSGDVTLDHAAWDGIVASRPFPPLPQEFSGKYLPLRFHFYYNPDKGDVAANPTDRPSQH